MTIRRSARDRFNRKNFPELFRLFKASETPGRIRNLLAGILSKIIDVEPIPRLPLKHERLRQLLDADFNVVDYRYWPRNQLWQYELEEFYHMYRRLSLRTFTEEQYNNSSPQLPVLYNVSDPSLINSFCRINSMQYHTLVNQALPLSDSLYSGGIILMDDKNYMVYCIKGHGTPRHADDPSAELLVFKRRFDEPIPNWAPPFLTDMSEQLRTLVPALRPITLEFSYYPYPVGLMKRQEVFWEWRGGSAHDLFRVMSRYIPQADSLELVASVGSGKKVLSFPTSQVVAPPVEGFKLPLTSTPRGRANLTLVK